MSKFCPITNSKVVYLECLDCEEKLCEKSVKNDTENIEKNVKNDTKNIQKSVFKYKTTNTPSFNLVCFDL